MQFLIPTRRAYLSNDKKMIIRDKFSALSKAELAARGQRDGYRCVGEPFGCVLPVLDDAGVNRELFFPTREAGFRGSGDL